MEFNSITPSFSIPSSVYSVPSNTTMINGVAVPLEYIDPVHFGIMLDPVIVHPTGNTFDRCTIDEIMKHEVCAKDPFTNIEIQSIIPNRGLKSAIERFLAQNPDLKSAVEQEETDKKAEFKKEEIKEVAEEAIHYTANQFMELFRTTDELTFPANKKIYIYGVSRKLTFKCSIEPKIEHFISIINNILLLIGKQLKLIRSEGILSNFAHLSPRSEETYISLIGTEELKFKVKRQSMTTKISQLLDRMNRANIDYLNLAPKQCLFLELSEEDRKHAVKVEDEDIRIKLLLTLFSSRLPKEIIGVTILPHNLKIIPPNEGLPFKRMALIGDKEGISIRLERIKE